jgi:hypothetical protein
MYDVLYKKCDLEKLPIKNVISGSEGYFLSSFMLQKFKYFGYKIILVQGNIANSKINKRVYLDPFDYRLVWGQAFFDDAVKNGVDANALMVVGDIASIECQRKQPREFKEVCTIGFFPDTRTFKPDAMYNYSVDLLQRFCRKNNLKLKIKIHPNLNKNNFETGLDYTVVTGIYGRECDPAVFMEQIDVAIVGNSTTLIECYSRWIPTMQIYNYDYRGTVFFDDVDLFRFSTDDELQALMDSINTPEFNAKMKRIHDYFVGDGNTRDNYINAFKKCGVL